MNKKKIKILRSDRQNYRHNFRTKSYIQYWAINSKTEEWANVNAITKRYNLHNCFIYYE